MALKIGKPLTMKGFTLTDVGAESHFLVHSRWVAGDGDGYFHTYAIDCIYSPERIAYQWIAYWYSVPVGMAQSLAQAIEILDKFPNLGKGYVLTGGGGNGTTG